MKLYPLFLLMATATIFSPGPGVVMTLSNALRYGFRGTFGGILGVAFGALIVAGISATSVGVVLAASATAFAVLKYLGAAYLIFLGIKLWRAPAFQFTEKTTHEASFKRRFLEGLSLQITNPKAIFFFLSIFPQFIDPDISYGMQFCVLVLTYSTLIMLIHSSYALFAGRAKNWLTSEKGGSRMNKIGAATFIFFACMLAGAKRST
ncbi:LysE family translocator [Undibacterium sp. TJN19]|uniref:LysE family translocator n=1 Tax=Undibacterium sp. TJN19 TaxID=3413055 RepID=UPI003BF418E1